MVVCHLNPREHIRLWHEKEKLVGYAILGEDPSFDWQVLPDHEWSGIEVDALRWAEEQLRKLRRQNEKQWDGSLVSGSRQDDLKRVAFLEQHGFQYCGDFAEVNLLRSLDEPILKSELPEGYLVREVLQTGEAAQRASIQHEVWRPWTVGNVSSDDYERFMQFPGYYRELDVVTVSPDGAIAAYVNGWIDPVNKIVAAGLGALALALVRRSGRDLLLLSGGAFAGLYGLRLASDTTWARLVLGLDPRLLAYVEVLVTYWIGLPGLLFFASVLGGRLERVLRPLLVVVLADASTATVADVLLGQPGAAMGPNSYLVLGTQVIAAATIFAPGAERSAELRVLRWSYAFLLVFVLNENLGGLGLPSVPGVEVFGFLGFLAGLGYAAAQRVFGNEQRLATLAQELETAGRIQASILPRALPRVAGLRVAVRYQPMTEVAGDFWDFFAGDGRVGLLVADVSGHGVPAALVASMVKVAFEAQRGKAARPAEVVEGMNAALCRALDGPFVTAIYAILLPAEGRVRFAGAGHPVNPVRYSRSEQWPQWKGTPAQMKIAHEYYLTARERLWIDKPPLLAEFDIDNDGQPDHVYFEHPCGSVYGDLFAVLTPDYKAVDRVKTERLMVHPPFKKLGLGALASARNPDGSPLPEWARTGYLKPVGDAISHVHYDFFYFSRKVYLDQWWRDHPSFQGEVDMKVGLLRVFETNLSGTQEICTYRFKVEG